MAAAYRSHSTGSTGSGNLVINKPAGTADGDVLVCGIIHATSNTSINWTSDGWTQRSTTPTSEGCFTVLTKVASGEGASWTFAPSVSNDSMGVIVAVQGGSGNMEVGTCATANDSGADDGIVTATLITTLNGCLVCVAGEEPNTASTFTHTGGSFIERVDASDAVNSDVHVGLFTQDGTTAGSKTITVTSSNAAMDTAACLVLVEDAGGAPPPKSLLTRRAHARHHLATSR